MSYSRINKLVCENTKLSSLAEATMARNIPINIVLGPDSTGKVATMACVGVALALRCFGGPVRIYIPEKEPVGLPWLNLSITNLLRKEAAQYGVADRLEIYNGYWDDSNTLTIGLESQTGVTVDSAGWIACINKEISPEVPAMAPAAIFASCCGFAKLFKSNVLGNSDWLKESWNFSLLNFNDTSNIPESFPQQNLDLGHIALLGAGAIGSGFAYTLWLSGWSATVDIIDKDIYKELNLETTLMVGKQDVKWQNKADTLAKLLGSRSGLYVNSVVTEISPRHLELDKHRDIFVCAVDNAETRRCLDNVNADMLLNGAVGGSRYDTGHVLWSRHLSNEPSLSVLYPEIISDYNNLKESEDVPIEITDQCSRLAYKGVDLAAPFIGLASAALLVSGCAHKALNYQLPENYFKFDILRRQAKYHKEKKV